MPSLNEDSYVDRMVMIGHPEGDTLITLYRPVPDEQWVLEVRFRQHVDDEIWNSQDKKTWQHYALDGKFTPEEAAAKAAPLIEKTRDLAYQVFGKDNVVFEELIIQGGIEAMLKKGENCSWMNIKKVEVTGPAGEA